MAPRLAESSSPHGAGPCRDIKVHGRPVKAGALRRCRSLLPERSDPLSEVRALPVKAISHSVRLLRTSFPCTSSAHVSCL